MGRPREGESSEGCCGQRATSQGFSVDRGMQARVRVTLLLPLPPLLPLSSLALLFLSSVTFKLLFISVLAVASSPLFRAPSLRQA